MNKDYFTLNKYRLLTTLHQAATYSQTWYSVETYSQPQELGMLLVEPIPGGYSQLINREVLVIYSSEYFV